MASPIIVKILAWVVVILALAVLVRLVILGRVSHDPPDLGLVEGQLRPCPSKPNCVSSLARGRSHSIAPIALTGPADRALQLAEEAIEAIPGGRVVVVDGSYLRAEFRSRLFQFVDDLELHWSDGDNVLHVRSASRVGTSDLGANRKRVERLRRLLDAE